MALAISVTITLVLHQEQITINNSADVIGDVAVGGGNLTTTASTANLFNTSATTLNIGGAATTLSLGASTGTTTIGSMD